MNLINPQEVSQISFELGQIATALQKFSEQKNILEWSKILPILLSVIMPILSVFFGYKIAIRTEDKKAGREILKGMVAALSDLERYINRLKNDLYGINYLLSQASEIFDDTQVNISGPWREIVQTLSQIQLRVTQTLRATSIQPAQVFILQQLQQKVAPLITDVDYFNNGLQRMDHKMLDYYHFLPEDIQKAYNSLTNYLATLSRNAYLDFQAENVINEIREVIRLSVIKARIAYR